VEQAGRLVHVCAALSYLLSDRLACSSFWPGLVDVAGCFGQETADWGGRGDGLSDYPRLSQQRKLIASVVVAGFDRVKIGPAQVLTSIESFMHNFDWTHRGRTMGIVNIF